jgi:hypothetical protein
VYLNRPYELLAKDRQEIEAILAGVLPRNLEMEWPNYDGALDVANASGPIVALITTGMLAEIHAAKGTLSGLRILGVVRKNGTTTYRYFVVVPKGTPLEPSTLKGRMVLKKAASLSGSLLPMAYLAERHGFPWALVRDEKVRAEWAEIQKFQVDPTRMCRDVRPARLHTTEGIAADRMQLEESGCDVYPRLTEPDAGFEITRSLLLARDLDDETMTRLQRFVFGVDSARLCELLQVEGFSPVDMDAVNRVFNRYDEIMAQVQHKPDPNFIGLARELLTEAIVQVPALKYALAVVGLAAAAFLVSVFFGFNLRRAFVATATMLVLMVAVLAFAVASKSAPGLVWAAMTLTYAYGGIAIVVPSLLLACVFFRRPLDLSHWLRDPTPPRRARRR